MAPRERLADIFEVFNSSCQNLDNLLNIDNDYFEQMVDKIYPKELQVNKTYTSETEALFLYLKLSIDSN